MIYHDNDIKRILIERDIITLKQAFCRIMCAERRNNNNELRSSISIMNQNEDLEEKKLLGSGGYAFAKLIEQEELNASLGVPHIFLGNVGRLNENRFSNYYCNKCAKEYPNCPVISYEYQNEELGEGIILVEKREYKCGLCDNVIAFYRRFIVFSKPHLGQTTALIIFSIYLILVHYHRRYMILEPTPKKEDFQSEVR
jgi:hypothetical protein